MIAGKWTVLLATGFQSTPALAGGRWALACQAHNRTIGFNPRPPLRAGDEAHTIVMVVGAVVSIHARPCGRAMGLTVTASSSKARFQSTPALAGGR